MLRGENKNKQAILFRANASSHGNARSIQVLLNNKNYIKGHHSLPAEMGQIHPPHTNIAVEKFPWKKKTTLEMLPGSLCHSEDRHV